MKSIVKIASIFFLSMFIANAYAMIPKYHQPSEAIIVTKNSRFFEIEQPANPTTGYQWRVKKYDSRFLTLESSRYLPPVSQLAGSGGSMIWGFQALPSALEQQHETAIELVYARPWSPNDNPKVVVFRVVFQNAGEAPEVSIQKVGEAN